ncbi:SVM family protein [Candidatus Phytoplasma meliae]|uniref:SVM family protein n=1 Tax=Candidatus Phytoplasma meliae TaxID=1848402 RepID=A0ABS5CZ39_9MOLU|nr:SVM family protein [Candidatus Phytoplasma meliae]MBP5836227.1 SVM family protein [Candidatus Phytoplasma meliae]
MFQLKNQFKTIYLCLIAFLGILFIFNNHQVMAAPKKEKGKEIASSKEIKKTNKKDVQNYFELYKTLENYSEEDRNKIIEILENPELLNALQQKAEEEGKISKEKGSSSKKSDESKK